MYAMYNYQIRGSGISKSSNIFQFYMLENFGLFFSSYFEINHFVVKYRTLERIPLPTSLHFTACY